MSDKVTSLQFRVIKLEKRIAELMSKLQNAQEDKLEAIKVERKRWVREDIKALAIRDLEQQALILELVRKHNERQKRKFGSGWGAGHVIENLQIEERNLRKQIEQLKGGDV